jgi:aldehyde dehydrogenase (NAD+)
MKNESFGPIGQVNAFSTESEEVLAKANDTEYGLYASVFTNDITGALRIAKELEAGIVAINSAAPTASLSMPFGGWKQSGNGVECGAEGFDLWTQIKTVIVAME